MVMTEITIRLVKSNDRQLHELIKRLDEDLLERYPSDRIYLVDFTNSKVTKMTFAIAYINGTPVACGGLRPMDNGDMELKRFYVDSSYRKQGIATQLLSYLEEKARKMGYKGIKLETGARQPEAIALYTKHGYVAIARFGEYTDDENCLCYGKILPL